MLRDARKSGDVASMSAATGLSDSSVEATGYDMLLERCKPAAQQILIKGPKGSGKTVLGLDLMRELYAEFDGEMSFFTNVKGPDDHPSVTFGETMSEMLEWVRDTDGEKCVLGDEWSTTMNSHAHPGGDIRQVVSRFINALRKGQGGSTRLIIIGHEHDSDIAAILRTQADVVIEKAGKADEGKSPTGPISSTGGPTTHSRTTASPSEASTTLPAGASGQPTPTTSPTLSPI
jgi:ATPase family associated with various cellular activities (AAA).